MKAITTKYIGPTNTRGARIKATDSDGNAVTLSIDYSLNHDQRHRAAALALVQKMNWGGEWVGGGTKDGQVYVCITHNDDRFTA